MSSRAFGVILSGALFLFPGAASATDVPGVDVPLPCRINVREELRTQYLVVGYEDRNAITIRGTSLTGSPDWIRQFPTDYLGSLAADETGQSVVVNLADHEVGFKSIAIREGQDLFMIARDHPLNISPGGRYFSLGGQVLNDAGEVVHLSQVLGKHTLGLGFVGEDHLLVTAFGKNGPDPGWLALIKLPDEVVWSRSLEGERLHIGDAQEAAIAMRHGLLAVGEWGAPSRPRRIYCFDAASGRSLWHLPLEPGALPGGVTIANDSTVIALVNSTVTAVDARNGTVVSRSAAPRNLLNSVRTTYYRDEVVFTVGINESGLPPYAGTLRINCGQDRVLRTELLDQFVSTAVVNGKLMGIRGTVGDESIQLRMDVIEE